MSDCKICRTDTDDTGLDECAECAALVPEEKAAAQAIERRPYYYETQSPSTLAKGLVQRLFELGFEIRPIQMADATRETTGHFKFDLGRPVRPGDIIVWEAPFYLRVEPPPPPELPTDPLWCPECKTTSPRSDWIETEVGCETCGDHPAMKCPACHEYHDTIFVSIGAPPEGKQS